MGEITHSLDKATLNVRSIPVAPGIFFVFRDESIREKYEASLYLYLTDKGCARGYIGQVEGANIIKLNRHKPKVSYLPYPKFDRDPHPALTGSLVIDLRTFDVRYYDYSNSENPPILHRKEEFVSAEYPDRTKFESLTRQEEHCGLYENTHSIGTREGWNRILKEKGIHLNGHRLIRV